MSRIPRRNRIDPRAAGHLNRMGEGEMWIATFADPDGNYFQLMSPWEKD
jgi:predicted lactoylglutathione lyase